MLGENGYPETPDWLPESRDGNVRSLLKVTLPEAMTLWDRDWSHWAGDDG